MDALLKLEKRLREAKEQLEKNAFVGYSDAQTGMPMGTAGGSGVSRLTPAGGVNIAKDDHCSEEDKKADKKMIEAKMDEHNEKMHGEAKDVNSAMKKGYNELVKFHANGQWSMHKADTMSPKPNGEFDVPVKEVYDGEDAFVHIGNRGVDGDDKGKTQKLSDKEKDLLKD